MAAELATLQIKVDSSEIKTADKALGDLGSTAGMVEKAVAALAAAWGAMKLAEFAKESVLLAARYETLGVVMGAVGANAGYSAIQMREFQGELQKTGISAIEARNTLSMAAAAQIDLTKASQMARIAQDAAVIGGINSSEAFAKMVQSIQTGMAILGHHIGLMVNFEEAYKRQAKVLHKSKEALTDHEKALARQNEYLRLGPTIQKTYEESMTTAGKQVKSMERYVQDLQTKLGDLALPAFTKIVFELAGALKYASEWFDKNKVSVVQMKEDIEGTVFGIKGMGKALGDLFSTNVTRELSGWEIAFKGLNITVGFLADTMNVLAGAARVVWNVGSLQIQNTGGGISQFRRGIGGENYNRAAFGEGEDSMETYLASKGGDLDKLMANRKRAHEQKAILAADENLKRLKESQEEAAKAAEKHAEAVDKLIKKLENQVYLEGRSRSEKTILEGAQAGLTRSQMAYVVSLAKIQDERDKDTEATKRAVEAAKLLNAAETKRAKDLELLLGNAEASTIQQSRQYQEQLTILNEETEKGRVTVEQYAAAMGYLYDNFTDAGKALKKYKDELSRDAERVKADVQTPEEKQIADLARLDAMLKGGLIGPVVYQRELIKLRSVGTDTFAMLADSIGSMTKGMEEAFVRFATTGKFSFKDMANSIIQDLIRIESQKAFTALASYLLGLAGDYFFPGTYASMRSTGEGLPTGGGSSTGIDTSLLGGPKMGISNPGGNVTSSVTVNVNSDGTSSSKVQGSAASGVELGNKIDAAVQKVMVREMRPGGLLNPVAA